MKWSPTWKQDDDFRHFINLGKPQHLYAFVSFVLYELRLENVKQQTYTIYNIIQLINIYIFSQTHFEFIKYAETSYHGIDQFLAFYVKHGFSKDVLGSVLADCMPSMSPEPSPSVGHDPTDDRQGESMRNRQGTILFEVLTCLIGGFEHFEKNWDDMTP